MTLVSELDLPVFDFTDPALRGPAFHTAIDELAKTGWLAAGPLGYVVLDREAAEVFLRSRQATFPGMKIAELFGVTEGPLFEQMRRNILHLNGDDHRRLRNLVNPAFTPRAAARWRPAMREVLEDLWSDLAGAGRCDALATLTRPYPARMIARVMGAPEADAGRLDEWSTLVQKQFDARALVVERDAIERAVEEFYAYAGELLARRRRDPGEDLISTLIAEEQAGDRLSDVELVNLVLNVLVGGVDTTQSQLAQALRLFAEHPEQWERLAAEPELAGRAVEEVLRVEPITPFTARIVLEEIELRGVTFPADTVVLVCALSANLEGVGEEFEPFAERPKDARPLTFGAGIHFCLGANLARAELEEGLRFLAPRMPGLALAGEPGYDSIQGIYGLEDLHVVWNPG